MASSTSCSGEASPLLSAHDREPNEAEALVTDRNCNTDNRRMDSTVDGLDDNLGGDISDIIMDASGNGTVLGNDGGIVMLTSNNGADGALPIDIDDNRLMCVYDVIRVIAESHMTHSHYTDERLRMLPRFSFDLPTSPDSTLQLPDDLELIRSGGGSSNNDSGNDDDVSEAMTTETMDTAADPTATTDENVGGSDSNNNLMVERDVTFETESAQSPVVAASALPTEHSPAGRMASVGSTSGAMLPESH